jgi:hypothetical protein
MIQVVDVIVVVKENASLPTDELQVTVTPPSPPATGGTGAPSGVTRPLSAFPPDSNPDRARALWAKDMPVSGAAWNDPDVQPAEWSIRVAVRPPTPEDATSEGTTGIFNTESWEDIVPIVHFNSPTTS